MNATFFIQPVLHPEPDPRTGNRVGEKGPEEREETCSRTRTRLSCGDPPADSEGGGDARICRKEVPGNKLNTLKFDFREYPNPEVQFPSKARPAAP